MKIEATEAYNLLLTLHSYNTAKRKVLLTLAHIYPRSVSGTQLAKMTGYSTKANVLYRGPIEELETDKLILVDRLTPKLYSIRINHEHPLMNLFIELSREAGEEIRTQFLEFIDGEAKTHDR